MIMSSREASSLFGFNKGRSGSSRAYLRIDDGVIADAEEHHEERREHGEPGGEDEDPQAAEAQTADDDVFLHAKHLGGAKGGKSAAGIEREN